MTDFSSIICITALESLETLFSPQFPAQHDRLQTNDKVVAIGIYALGRPGD
jgi:hypothetical protein